MKLVVKLLTKAIILILMCFATREACGQVEIIPSERLGHRGHARLKEIEWKCTHDKLGKLTKVCRSKPTSIPVERMIAEAKEAGMTLQKGWGSSISGTEQEGMVWYHQMPHKTCFYNPNSGLRYFALRNITIQHNGDLVPKPKGMPSDAEAVLIAHRWLGRLGIDKSNLMPDPSAPGGCRVELDEATRSWWDRELNRQVSAVQEKDISFSQRIGDLPADWHGFGGRVLVVLADGGEFASARYCLRGWEPIGEFPILTQNEITVALKEGFCWVEEPIEAEKAEITAIDLVAFHDTEDRPQKHFAPVWRLIVQPEGKPDNRVQVRIPALQQHRDKYPLKASESR